jgi:hypothetical protein
VNLNLSERSASTRAIRRDTARRRSSS